MTTSKNRYESPHRSVARGSLGNRVGTGIGSQCTRPRTPRDRSDPKSSICGFVASWAQPRKQERAHTHPEIPKTYGAFRFHHRAWTTTSPPSAIVAYFHTGLTRFFMHPWYRTRRVLGGSADPRQWPRHGVERPHDPTVPDLDHHPGALMDGLPGQRPVWDRHAWLRQCACRPDQLRSGDQDPLSIPIARRAWPS